MMKSKSRSNGLTTKRNAFTVILHSLIIKHNALTTIQNGWTMKQSALTTRHNGFKLWHNALTTKYNAFTMHWQRIATHFRGITNLRWLFLWRVFANRVINKIIIHKRILHYLRNSKIWFRIASTPVCQIFQHITSYSLYILGSRLLWIY